MVDTVRCGTCSHSIPLHATRHTLHARSLLIYHCGKELERRCTGPFFYCSKVENYLEARLWNAVFTWAEAKLGLTRVCRWIRMLWVWYFDYF